MMNKNLEERIDSRFGEMAKKFDLFSDKISVRDREIDVIIKRLLLLMESIPLLKVTSMKRLEYSKIDLI
jgi:hypothetical protein